MKRIEFKTFETVKYIQSLPMSLAGRYEMDEELYLYIYHRIIGRYKAASYYGDYKFKTFWNFV